MNSLTCSLVYSVNLAVSLISEAEEYVSWYGVFAWPIGYLETTLLGLECRLGVVWYPWECMCMAIGTGKIKEWGSDGYRLEPI